MKSLIFIASVLFLGTIAFAQEVALDPVFVPPSWLQEVILLIKSLPLVGPYVVKILEWLGVASVILTTATGAIITILKALAASLKLAKLDALAAKVKEFEKSKVIFWLKYFSNFNAQKAVK